MALSWWFVYQDISAGDSSYPAIAICLAVTVWAIYLADRAYDAIWTGADTHSPRKAFAQAHPRLLHSLLTISSLASLAALFFLPRGVLMQASIIAACTLLFFFLWRWRALSSPIIPSKEIWIGLTWAAAIALPWQVSSPAITIEQLSFLLIFSGLCCINCLIIAEREEATDRLTDPASWFAGHRRRFPFLPVLASLLVATLCWCIFFQHWTAGALLAASTILLWSVWHYRLPSPQTLCDAALWLPAAVILGLKAC